MLTIFVKQYKIRILNSTAEQQFWVTFMNSISWNNLFLKQKKTQLPDAEIKKKPKINWETSQKDWRVVSETYSFNEKKRPSDFEEDYWTPSSYLDCLKLRRNVLIRRSKSIKREFPSSKKGDYLTEQQCKFKFEILT